MSTLALDEDWTHICQFFPSDLDEIAKTTGAVTRWRKLLSGEELLRLCLAYAVEDLSLRSTAAWSARTQWTAIKDTSVLYRLRCAAPFLEAVLAHLLNHHLQTEEVDGPILRLVDATVLSIPGSVGTDWRLHCVYEPRSRRLCAVQVTDYSGGERLDRGGYGAGDVVIADRGLAHAAGIHAVAEAGASCLLRMHWQNIRLEGVDGCRLEIHEILRRADLGDTGTVVLVPLRGHQSVLARLIVRPLPTAQAAAARAQLRRNASKKGRTPSALALELAGYFSLLTTLPTDRVTDEAACELYRVRWQIELFFKRAKSLLRLDALRADDPQLVRAYCLCKLVAISLVELLATEGESLSPWGVPLRRRPAAKPMAAHPYP